MAKSYVNNELFAAITAMAEEKGISADFIKERIATAIITSVKKEYEGRDVVHCEFNDEKNTFKVFVRKDVVDEVEDPYSQITLSEAQLYNKRSKVGGTVDIPLDTKQFGRIIAGTAKQIIHQGISDAEKGQAIIEFQSKKKELVSALVQRIDPRTGNATISIGRSVAVLPRTEQVPDEVLHEGDHIKVYIVDVKEMENGKARVMLSRTHSDFVKRLFELEVPEIFDGKIEIKSVSRQAGSRTKMAVYSADPDIDPVGACIGQRGARVNEIVEELGGEKIDIVRYSDDPVAFISEALSPAKVLSVEILDEEERKCKATVPDSQLSLAIGNKGQNVRLAAHLTGWKIDIKPESGFYGEE